MKKLLYLFTILLFPALLSAQENENMQVSKAFYLPVSKTVFIKLGNRNIPVLLQQYGRRQDLVLINLHDDETSSVNAARKVLESAGGLLIKIQNNGQRLVRFMLLGKTFKFDPNRIYSKEGIETTLDKFGYSSPEAIERIGDFGKELLSLIPASAACVVALHNNTDGGYSVKSYMKGSSMEGDAKEIYYNPRIDPDNFVFTTDSVLFRQMAGFEFNAVLQDNANADRDGSLSVYFGENNRRYINIETQDGKEKEYRDMLEKLFGILDLSVK